MGEAFALVEEIETGKIVGGFTHDQVLALTDKAISAVQSGAIKRFAVMAGCDSGHKSRIYYTGAAETLPWPRSWWRSSPSYPSARCRTTSRRW